MFFKDIYHEKIMKDSARKAMFAKNHKPYVITKNGWDFSVISQPVLGKYTVDDVFEVGIFKRPSSLNNYQFRPNEVKENQNWTEVKNLQRTFEVDPVMAFESIRHKDRKYEDY